MMLKEYSQNSLDSQARTGLIPTTVHEDACKIGWGPQQAHREFGQNLFDQAKRGFPASWNYNPDTEEITYENKGCVIPLEAIFSGWGDKANNRDLAGVHGDGFPNACVVIARTPGYDMVIQNGPTIWKPSLAPHPVIGSSCLNFDIQPNPKWKDGHALYTRVIVSGVSAEEYEVIQDMFLEMREKWMTKSQVVTTREGRLLLHPELKGKLYVKGIYVQTVPNLEYGYDLHNVELGRDRDIMHSYDRNWKLREIWERALAIRPSLAAKWIELLNLEGLESAEDMGAIYSGHNFPEKAVKELEKAFKALHGKKAIPVSSTGESREMEHLGQGAGVLNQKAMAILKPRLGGVEKARERLVKEVTKTYSWSKLTSEEKKNLEATVELLSLAEEGFNLDRTTVVDFLSPEIAGQYKDNRILVRRSGLGDVGDTLATLVHEWCHRFGDEDGTVKFRQLLEDTWVKITMAQAQEIARLRLQNRDRVCK